MLDIKPLRVFVDPDAGWHEVFGFGQDVPAPWRVTLGERSDVVVLQLAGAVPRVYAPCAGYLTTRHPDHRRPSRAALAPPDVTAPTPDAVLVYLAPSPLLDLQPGFRQRLDALAPVPPTNDPAARWNLLMPPRVAGFILGNLATGALRTSLETTRVSQVLGRLGAGQLPRPQTQLEREHEWRRFLAGEVDLLVDAGADLGLAAPSATTSGADDLVVGVLLHDGAHDPAHFYDRLRDQVDEEHKVDSLLGVMPVRWPVVGSGGGRQAAVDATAEQIMPLRVLEELRQRFALSFEEWRQIGDHQKALIRDRLVRRHFAVDSTDPDPVPPFEFDDVDWRNPFQLEAITEFYVNFDDPNATGASPRAPGSSGYEVVDLLPPAGFGATSTGTVATLPGSAPLDDIWPGRDSVEFVVDTARPGRRYRIMRVDAANRQVHLDGAPALPVPSGWQVRPRPTLVVIDPLGPVIEGRLATIVSTTGSGAGASTTVGLDATSTELEAITGDGFESIWFAADAGASDPPRTFRVQSVDRAQQRVTVAGRPHFGPENRSRWASPAGLGGRLPSQSWSVGPTNGRGRDQYAGVAFVIDGGEVVAQYRFTSYSSRNYPAGNQLRSSLRGNRRYSFDSYVGFSSAPQSGDDFRNYSMKVVDAGAVPRGHHAIVNPSTTAPTEVRLVDGGPLDLVAAGDRIRLLQQSTGSDEFDIVSVDPATRIVTLDRAPTVSGISAWDLFRGYDGVVEARHYFDATVTADSAPAGTRPVDLGAGKTAIRIHHGNSTTLTTGTGSAGCLVSPEYYRLRTQLIGLELADARARGAAVDLALDRVRARTTHGTSRALHVLSENNPAASTAVTESDIWHKVGGTLWVIRPDERQL